MQTVTFDYALDVVEALSREQQDSLMDIVKKRRLEQRREEILREIEEGKAEFQRGELQKMSVSELMKDLLE